MQITRSGPGGYTYTQLKKLGLSDEGASRGVEFATIKTYAPRQLIWAKGQKVESWCFAVTGYLSASVGSIDGQRVYVGIYGPNTWLGEQPIINAKLSYLDYASLTSTDLICIPAEILLELLEKEVRFALKITKLVSWRAQKKAETLMLMKLGSTCLRVIFGIALFAETIAYHNDRPPTLGYGEGIEIPVKQDVLASLCGVSRTVFSQHIQTLALNGWIRISYTNIEILEFSAWRRFAEQQRERHVSDLNPTIDDLLSSLRRLNSI